MAVAIGRAEAADIPLRGEFAGTFLTSRINLNNDGELAGWGTEVVEDELLGQSSNQVIVENALVPPTGACREGRLEFHLVAGRIVATFLNTRDQLFSELTSRTLCLNPANGRFRGRDTGAFTGGTGRFAGATGSFEARYTGSSYSLTPTPLRPSRSAILLASTRGH